MTTQRAGKITYLAHNYIKILRAINERKIVSPQVSENGASQVVEDESSREPSSPDVEIVEEADEEGDSYETDNQTSDQIP